MRSGLPGTVRLGWAVVVMVISVLGAVFAAAPGADDAVRSAAKAGSWYPADAVELSQLIDGLLQQAPRQQGDAATSIRALVVPHAAYRYSGATAAAVYRSLRGLSYRRVILLGPAHRASYQRGLSILDVEAYETPLGSVPLDREAIAALRQSPAVDEAPLLHEREHSLEIQLPFLQRVLSPGWRLVPVLVGVMHEPDYREAAEAIRPLLDASSLLVVSTDFTHYGAGFQYLPFPVDGQVAERIRGLDMGAFAHVVGNDPKAFLRYRRKTGITVCGYRALALLLHLTPAQASVELLSYTTSGEMTGDYRHSVSYIGALVTEP